MEEGEGEVEAEEEVEVEEEEEEGEDTYRAPQHRPTNDKTENTTATTIIKNQKTIRLEKIQLDKPNG